MKSTPAHNSFTRVRFCTLAGVRPDVRFDGSLIVGRFATELSTLCAPSNGELIERFVNWPRDPASIVAFTKKYGPLSNRSRESEELVESMLADGLSPTDDDYEHLIGGARFRFTVEEWERSQASFRELWKGINGKLPVPGASPKFNRLAEELDVHFKEMLRAYGYDNRYIINVKEGESLLYLRGGGIEYRAQNLKRLMFLDLLSRPIDRVRVCAYPDCKAPFFVATHLGQKYSSEGCARWAQQQWKKQWWDEHGKKWRAERSGKKSAKSQARKRR